MSLSLNGSCTFSQTIIKYFLYVGVFWKYCDHPLLLSFLCSFKKNKKKQNRHQLRLGERPDSRLAHRLQQWRFLQVVGLPQSRSDAEKQHLQVGSFYYWFIWSLLTMKLSFKTVSAFGWVESFLTDFIASKLNSTQKCLMIENVFFFFCAAAEVITQFVLLPHSDRVAYNVCFNQVSLNADNKSCV